MKRTIAITIAVAAVALCAFAGIAQAASVVTTTVSMQAFVNGAPQGAVAAPAAQGSLVAVGGHLVGTVSASQVTVYQRSWREIMATGAVVGKRTSWRHSTVSLTGMTFATVPAPLYVASRVRLATGQCWVVQYVARYRSPGGLVKSPAVQILIG